ncbi:MAG: caspase domain-containing protein [Pseudomonadota bacterium]
MPHNRSRNLGAIVAVCCSWVALLVAPAAAEKRVALVVGNSGYVNTSALANPSNDAGDVAAALKEAGFEVILGLDLEKRAFDAKLRDFARALGGADTALFYYAGHGLQVSGRNHLVPIDAELKGERDLDFEAVSLDFVLRQMELEREGKTNIVLLDACRDNPLARNLARTMGTRSASVGSGLAQVQTGVGTFIAYSTQPGNVALDGTGRNSPFTAALTKGIRLKDRNLTAVMIEVRKEVLAVTQGKQVPWDHSALTGDFYFQLAAAPGGVPPGASPPAPGAGNDALNKRVKELESELERRVDPRQAANIARLEQLRERVRRMEEEGRADQQRIFDTMNRRSSRDEDAQARADKSFEIGRIQVQMSRRNQERQKVLEEIKALEAETGLAPAKAEAR